MKNDTQNNESGLTKIESVYLPYVHVTNAGDRSERTTGISLSSPVLLPSGSVSPYALCRMCAIRLCLLPTERLILCLVLDEQECGIRHVYSYAELGTAVGKSEHSAKRAVAALRRRGLLLSSRVGRTDATMAFSCDAFVRWAETTLNSSGAPVCDPRPLPCEVCDIPDTPAVRKVAKKERRISRQNKQDAPSLEEQLAEARRFDLMGFDINNLPPGCSVTADGRVSFDFKSGHPVPPQFQPAEDDTPVDASSERNHTLALAGARDADDDEDVISFGAETSDTDMGHGVVVNPDL